VVSIHQDRDGCSFEQMRPAAKSSHDSKEFMVVDGVVLLRLHEFLGMESHRSSWSWFLSAIWFGDRGIPLVKYCSCTDLRSVGFEFELSVWVGSGQDGCTGDHSDELFLGLLLLGSPFEWYVFSGKCCKRCGNDTEVWAEHAVVTGDS